MPLDVIAIPGMVVVELALLAATIPLSLIAARGFWNAPFGRLMRPLPAVFFLFLVMDAGNLLSIALPRWYFHAVGVPALLLASYAAIQGAMLLSERREV